MSKAKVDIGRRANSVLNSSICADGSLRRRTHLYFSKEQGLTRKRSKQSGGVGCQFRQRRRKTKVAKVNEPREN